MRTVVHLSDVHFGRTDGVVVEALVAHVGQIRPHVVVVSGDLTQRARADEFRQARAFLDRLPRPQIDDEIAVVGVNTARALTFKNGRVNEDQVASIHRRLDPLAETLTKIVVTHHPFDLPDEPQNQELVGRGRMAMDVFATCGVDLLLAGHFHTSQAGDTSGRYQLGGYSALVVQAGTATSTRARGESNAFNVRHISDGEVAVDRQLWDAAAGRFELERTERFRREGGRWLEQKATS
jgi:3',5'-cyclic AMP phosphodiesterase CpdA